jgi:hypothetical protein
VRASGLILRSLATFAGIAGLVAGVTWADLSARAVVHGGGPCYPGDTGPAGVPCDVDLFEAAPFVLVGGIGCLALYRVGIQAGPRLRFLILAAAFLGAAYAFIADGRALESVIFLVPGAVLVVAPLRNAAGWRRTWWADPDTEEEAW